MPAIVEYELIVMGCCACLDTAAAPRLAALAQLLRRDASLLPFSANAPVQLPRFASDWRPWYAHRTARTTLIAATALRHQATLVTRNVREFSRVLGLECLNWHPD